VKIVTFAVGAAHVAASVQLRASLLALDPPAEINVVQGCVDLGRREALKYKPRVIFDELVTAPQDDVVLWLDADCVVRGPLPVLPDGAEISGYSPTLDYWVDGVLLVRNCKATRALMGAWRDKLDLDVWEATDVELSRLILEMQIAVVDLAPEDCWRESWGMKERYGNRVPRIVVTEVA